MQCQVLPQEPVAIGEHPLQFPPDERSTTPVTEYPQRQLILYMVFQITGGRSVRFHPMGVDLMREWSRHLDIAKLATLLIVLMLRHPILA